MSTEARRLRGLVDPMDAGGLVHVSQRRGLGVDIQFDHIDEHAADGP